MANIIAENEIFFTQLEPKMKNRFVLYMDGVPTYSVRRFTRPTVRQDAKEMPHINVSRYVKGKTTWGTMQMTLYDAITPSGAQMAIEWLRLHHESVTGRDGYAAFYKKDLILNMLGPVGDKVEEWLIKGAMITEINWGDADFSTDEIADVTITIQPDYCILNY